MRPSEWSDLHSAACSPLHPTDGKERNCGSIRSKAGGPERCQGSGRRHTRLSMHGIQDCSRPRNPDSRALNQHNVGVALLNNPHIAVRRGIIDDDDFERRLMRMRVEAFQAFQKTCGGVPVNDDDRKVGHSSGPPQGRVAFRGAKDHRCGSGLDGYFNFFQSHCCGTAGAVLFDFAWELRNGDGADHGQESKPPYLRLVPIGHSKKGEDMSQHDGAETPEQPLLFRPYLFPHSSKAAEGLRDNGDKADHA